MAWAKTLQQNAIRHNILVKRKAYFKSIKSQIKGILRKRGLLVCAVCEAKENLELHHIVPLALNGNNDISNLMVLCHDHHVKIHKDKEDLVIK